MKLLERRRALISAFARFVRTVLGKLPLTLTACASDKSVIDYKLYGNSVQNGTPTPDAPVEVESVGELVTDETDVNYGKYKIPVKASGKNLFNPNEALGKYLTSSYLGTDVSRYGGSNYILSISLKEGKSVPKDIYFGLGHNAAYGDSISAIWFVTGGKIIRSSRNFNTLSNYKNISICVHPADKNSWDKIMDAFDIQLEKGSAVTDFEPYREPITTNIYLDEPLCKIGDYADYIDFEQGKVVRSIRYTQMKSSYVYSLSGATSSKTIVVLINGTSPFNKGLLAYAKGRGFCNIGKVGWLHEYRDTEVVYWSYNTNITTFFAVPTSILTELGYEKTEQGIKDFIDHQNAINPIMVEFVLKTPIEKPIELPTLPTFKGTTIYSVDTNIQPSNMEVTYYSKERDM